MMIDINCDLGEFEAVEAIQKDHQLMNYISRANIACGGHAGSDATMKSMLQAAKSSTIFVGAHPSYPDKANFGRQSMNCSFEVLSSHLRRQIDTLLSIAEGEGVQLAHIKCHGALYNDLEKDESLANQIAELFAVHYPELSLLGLTGAELAKACNKTGQRFLQEGFMDRAYLANGQLTPRSQPGAVIEDVSLAIEQAIKLAKGECIHSIDGQPLMLKVDSICLHGDNAQVLAIARRLLTELHARQIQVSTA